MVDERRGLLDLPSLISDELLSRVPGLKEAFRAVDSALQLWFPTTTIATGPMRAVHIASSLAINDFVDLLADLLAGRGRSAVRALRNLFEHLISVLDFGASPLAQQRFIEHRAITEQTAAALTFELDRLLDDERRAEVRRLRKLGKGSARAAAKAIRDYGAGFKRGWAAETLSERAARHGLAGEYEIYRLSSAVLHGSSGGAIGTVFGSAGDRRRSIHRLGPALQLCPISYLKGIAYFKRIVMEIQAIDSSDEVAQRAQPLLVALEGMDGLWGDYRRAVLELDVDLFATAIPVPTLLTVLAFERDGTISWWLWNLASRFHAGGDLGLIWGADTRGRMHGSACPGRETGLADGPESGCEERHPVGEQYPESFPVGSAGPPGVSAAGGAGRRDRAAGVLRGWVAAGPGRAGHGAGPGPVAGVGPVAAGVGGARSGQDPAGSGVLVGVRWGLPGGSGGGPGAAGGVRAGGLGPDGVPAGRPPGR